jgi:hypothetical protein
MHSRLLKWFLVAAALLGAASPAWACQCDDPAQLSEAEQEKGAKWLAEKDLIVAEVERLDPSEPNTPETYKVVRPMIGSAPAIISVPTPFTKLEDGTVLRGPITSCDYAPPAGRRVIMAFFNPSGAPSCGVLARISA